MAEISMKRRTALALVGAGIVGVAVSNGTAEANTPAATRRRGYADGPYGLVHFQDTGGAGIPLVLCHQSPQSSRQFDTVLPEFIRLGIRAIAVDTPGFGMSDAPDFVPTIEDYARAIPAVLDHLKIPVTNMAGHHTGAQVATEVALQFPNRVKNLVMHGPNPITEEQRQRALERVVAREKNFVYEPDGSHLMKSFQLRWKLYGPGGDPNLTTRVIAEKFIGYGPFWYGHHASFSYDHAASLRKISHRTMIMTNTGDEIYEAAQVARKIRPDFAYAEFDGGTVDIVDQQPQAWAAAIAQFIRS
jgi:pimeloyl-ACP methyl ester carboxylesterase